MAKNQKHFKQEEMRPILCHLNWACMDVCRVICFIMFLLKFMFANVIKFMFADAIKFIHVFFMDKIASAFHFIFKNHLPYS